MSELKPKLVLAKSKRGGRFKLILLLLFTFGIGVFVGTRINTLNIMDREASMGKEAKVDNSEESAQEEQKIESEGSNLAATTLTSNLVKSGKELEEPTASGKSLPQKDYKYTIQVAAFEGMEKAQGIVTELNQKGYDAYIVPITNSRGETWNLIKVGKLNTLEEAQDAANILQQKEMLEAIIEELKQE